MKGPKPKTVFFNEFFPFLAGVARERGLGKTEWMTLCGIPRQRFSEFTKAITGAGGGKPRNVTARYFLRLMEGLQLTQADVEKLAGRSFTEEQKRELKIEQFVLTHRDVIEALVDNPEALDAVRGIIKAFKR